MVHAVDSETVIIDPRASVIVWSFGSRIDTVNPAAGLPSAQMTVPSTRHCAWAARASVMSSPTMTAARSKPGVLLQFALHNDIAVVLFCDLCFTNAFEHA